VIDLILSKKKQRFAQFSRKLPHFSLSIAKLKNDERKKSKTFGNYFLLNEKKRGQITDVFTFLATGLHRISESGLFFRM